MSEIDPFAAPPYFALDGRTDQGPSIATARMVAAVVMGCVTLGLSLSLFSIVRAGERGRAGLSFAAMVAGLIAGPCLAGSLLQRAVKGKLEAKSLAVGGAVGAVILYSVAVLAFECLSTMGSTRGIPRLYAVAAWWSLALFGPAMGVLFQPATQGGMFRLMFGATSLLGTIVFYAPLGRWSLERMLWLTEPVITAVCAWKAGRRELDIAASPVYVAVFVLVFAGPAALLLWVCGVSQMPPYWRR